ncbi:MAG: methionyl-tRNA formyltransferase, partial [Desulfobacterales bacterium]|nr:methionyl-tRNA formyltransferase [Desulfobacterales bacterium]
MGTPDFAVASLDRIKNAGIEIAGVITAPDKPAGRGKKIHFSAVKTYALENNLPNLMQPTNLKDESFTQELKSLQADLFVVVAFRMLPESVWAMPPKGTINLHASLLPQYRGAAPINWAVINGETKTGASTFFIEKEIDTGKIIDQVKIDISEFDTAGTVHDKLMNCGADLLVKTILSIEKGEAKAMNQNDITLTSELKTAPKLFKDTCKIDWTKNSIEIHNLIRGLSPYPAAWTNISVHGNPTTAKIFESDYEISSSNEEPGTVISDNNKVLKIATGDGYILVKEIQIAGKKRMATEDLL